MPQGGWVIPQEVALTAFELFDSGLRGGFCFEFTHQVVKLSQLNFTYYVFNEFVNSDLSTRSFQNMQLICMDIYLISSNKNTLGVSVPKDHLIGVIFKSDCV